MNTFSDAETLGSQVQLSSAFVLVAFFFLVGFVMKSQSGSGMKPGEWMTWLMYKRFCRVPLRTLSHSTPSLHTALVNVLRVGTPSKGCFENDYLFIGPINEFLTASMGEAIMLFIIFAWLVLNVVVVYLDLIDETTGWEHHLGSKTRAFGGQNVLSG